MENTRDRCLLVCRREKDTYIAQDTQVLKIKRTFLAYSNTYTGIKINMAPRTQLIPLFLGFFAAAAAVDRTTPPDGCLTVGADGDGEYRYKNKIKAITKPMRR